MVEAIDALVFIEMKDALGIGIGPEPMPFADQVLSKGKVIIDLPIVDNVDRVIFVGDWLSASLDADDAQSAHPDTDVATDQTPLVIRTPMTDGIAHQVDVFLLNRRTIEREYA